MQCIKYGAQSKKGDFAGLDGDVVATYWAISLYGERYQPSRAFCLTSVNK